MSTNEVGFAISSLIGLLVLGWLLYGPFQALLCEIVRQQLFEIRDRLFDLALSGRISFEDEGYRFARARINANIRFAHKASIWRVLALAPTTRRVAPLPQMPSSPEHALISRHLRRMEYWMVGLMWLRSPLLVVVTLLVAVPIAWIAFLSDAFRIASAKYFKAVNSAVNREAMAERAKPKSWLWQT